MVEGAEILYDAVLTGDVTAFQQLLREDPNLLDRVSFVCSNSTPLHIATLKEELGIVREILQKNNRLAEQLDSQKSSPLHIAAANGHFEIACLLLAAAPNMCWWRDCHGMNPVHVAATSGCIEILGELIQSMSSPAREKLDRGQTILHLCVKHGQIGALDFLAKRFGELVLVEDDDGDTILHLAARWKKYQIIRHLVENNIVEKSKKNSREETAMDILDEFPPDKTTSEIKDILWTWSWQGSSQSLNKIRETVMVISVLIATMAFQAVVSPPGGVWQDSSLTDRVGTAIMAYTHPEIYKHFTRANTVAFISSLITIFLLTTGLSKIHLLVTVAVMHIMWVSVASIGVSYGASLVFISPHTERKSIALVIWPVVAVSLSLLVLFHLRRFYRGLKSIKKNSSNHTATAIRNVLMLSQ